MQIAIPMRYRRDREHLIRSDDSRPPPHPERELRQLADFHGLCESAAGVERGGVVNRIAFSEGYMDAAARRDRDLRLQCSVQFGGINFQWRTVAETRVQ